MYDYVRYKPKSEIKNARYLKQPRIHSFYNKILQRPGVGQLEFSQQG
jgi:hypothetical protein